MLLSLFVISGITGTVFASPQDPGYPAVRLTQQFVAESAGNYIYRLVVSAISADEIASMAVVFSYDNTVIIPVHATTRADVVIPNNSQPAGGPITPFELISTGTNLVFTAPSWLTAGGRTGVTRGVALNDPIWEDGIAPGAWTDVFAFHFRVAGNDLSLLSSDTFRIESADGMLGAAPLLFSLPGVVMLSGGDVYMWNPHPGALAHIPLPDSNVSVDFINSRSVSVGIQSGTMTAGQAGSVTFDVTTDGIPAGIHAITVANLPAGVSVQGGNTIAINASGQGTLTLVGDTTTVDGATTTLTLAFNNLSTMAAVGTTITTGPATSEQFTLTVDEALSAPTITSADNATIPFGTADTFNVTATGSPAAAFTLSGQPTGVTIDSATGVMSIADTTAAGVHSFDIIAANGQTPDYTQSFTLTITQAPAITSANSTSVEELVGGSFTVTATGTPVPTFALAGTVPAGVTIDSTTGVMTIAASTVAGTHSFDITATNAVDVYTQNFTLTVTIADFAPTITSANGYSVSFGAADTFTVTATGSPAATFTLSGQPTGVTIDSATGVMSIADTTAAGVHNFDAIATNAVDSYTQSFTLTVTQAPTITSTSSTSVAELVGGSFTVTAAGTPTPTFALTGAVPAGVTIDSNTGVMTIAVTTAAGVHSFDVTAANTVDTYTQAFTLTVTAATFAPTITSASSTSVAELVGGSFTVAATGTPTPTFALTGAVPAGVTIDSNTGVMTIAATTAAGVHNFNATATNIVDTYTQAFTLTVTAATFAPVITSANSASVAELVGGSFTVTATGTPAPTFALTGTVPAGVTIDGVTGVMTVAASTAAGVHNFNVTATNVEDVYTQSFTLTVTAANFAPTITSASNATMPFGAADTFSVTATGLPAATFTLSGAPSGVTIDSISGIMAIGSTTAAGAHTFDIIAANGEAPNYTQSFTLTITQAPGITSSNSHGVTEGTADSFTVTATGHPTPTLSISGQPSGVTFDALTGVITIAATTAAGTHNFDIVAANVVDTYTQAFTLTIAAATFAPTITSASSASVAELVGGSFTVTATGTPTPTFALTGTVPAGVSIDSTTGVMTIAATTAAGTHNFNVTAANTVDTYTQAFTLTVTAATFAPVVTSANNTSVAELAGGSFTVTATGTPAPTFALTGTVPAGVTIDSSTGVMTIAATVAAGVHNFNVTATNAVDTYTQAFTLTVTAATFAPIITSASSTSVAELAGGSFTVTATGTPTPTFALTGTVPAGVTIDSTTGVMTIATTTAAGVHNFNITATNAVDVYTQTFTLTVTVSTVAPTITSASSATISFGTADTVTVTATGTPAPTFALTGTIPAGVTIDSTTGVMTIAATVAAGVHNFNVTATNVADVYTQSFTLTVNAAANITSQDNHSVAGGTAGSFTVTATGHPTPALSISGQPSGVTFDALTGIMSIAATTASGVYSITITATNGIGSPATQSFTLTITPQAFPLTVSTVGGGIASASPSGNVNEGEIVALTATANSGQEFVTWTSSGAAISFASATSPITTFTMPAGAVTVTANFQAMPPTVTGVTVSPSTIDFQEGVGGVQQFAATVHGTPTAPAQGVNWGITGPITGATAISTTGLLAIDPAQMDGDTFTITATSIADGSHFGTAIVTVIPGTPPPVHSIALDIGGTHTFPSVTFGYASGDLLPLTVTVTNTGNQIVSNLNISSSAEFIVSPASLGSISVGGSATFTVTPAVGLAEGPYSATISVTGPSGETGTFNVDFTVNPAAAPTFPVAIATNNVAQNGLMATAVVTPTGDQEAGSAMTVTVTLSGTATAAGVHTIGLTSGQAGGITAPGTLTRTVTAGEAAINQGFVFTFTMPAAAVADLTVTHSFTAAATSFPVAIATNNVAQNGLTATGVVTPSGNQLTGAPITVTVTLSGTATAAGTHTIGLASTQAGAITAPAVLTRIVSAGESAVNQNFVFTFAMPANAVTDLAVVHNFTAAAVTTFPVTVAGSHASTTGAGNFAPGATVSINAGTRSGFNFAGWTASPSISFANANSRSTSFTMPSSAVTITANWTPITTPPAATQLAAPTGLVISGTTLSWSAVVNASGYRIYVGGQPVGNATATTFNLASLALVPGTYPVQVRATGDTTNFTNSALSASVSFVVQDTQPPTGGTSGGGQGDTGQGDTDGVPIGTPSRRTTAATPTATPEPDVDTVDTTETPIVTTVSTPTPSPERMMYTPASQLFTDVSADAWYHIYIGIAVNNNLFQGTAANTFAPNAIASRAMFVQALADLEGADLSAFADVIPTFDDVHPGSWYFAAVEWAAAMGIVTGMGDGSFGANIPATREQIATMLHRYVQIMGIAIPQGIAASFADQANVSPWAAEAVAAMQAAGIVSGRPDGTFDPQATTTRAEASAIFVRLLTLIQ